MSLKKIIKKMSNKLVNWTNQVDFKKDHTLNQHEPSCITVRKDGYLHKIIKKDILKKLNLQDNAFFDKNRFPLYQPKTFNHLSLNRISQQNIMDWFLSLKSDGCRFMLTSHQLDDRFANPALIHLMIDRSFNMFIVHIEEKSTNSVSYIVDCEFIVRDDFSKWNINTEMKSGNQSSSFEIQKTDPKENKKPYTMIHFFDMWYYKDKLLKKNVERFLAICDWYCETIEEVEYIIDLSQMYKNMIDLSNENHKHQLYQILKNTHQNKFFSYVWDEWKTFETELICRSKITFAQKYGVNTFIADPQNTHNKTMQFIPSCIKPFVPAFCAREANKYCEDHSDHNDGLIFCDAYHIYKYKTNYTVDFIIHMKFPLEIQINKMNGDKKTVYQEKNIPTNHVIDLDGGNMHSYDYCFMDESKQFFYYCQFELDKTHLKNIEHSESETEHILECSLVVKKKQQIKQPQPMATEIPDGVWNLQMIHCLIEIKMEKKRTDKNHCNNERTLQQSLHLQMNPINVEHLFC